jgi:hypothetical protein
MRCRCSRAGSRCSGMRGHDGVWSSQCRLTVSSFAQSDLCPAVAESPHWQAARSRPVTDSQGQTRTSAPFRCHPVPSPSARQSTSRRATGFPGCRLGTSAPASTGTATRSRASSPLPSWRSPASLRTSVRSPPSASGGGGRTGRRSALRGSEGQVSLSR